jgi:phenylalanyl-tRNA synthetase beta chain
VIALKKAANLIVEIAGGYISSDVVDIYPNRVEPARVFLTYQHINDLIGQVIPKEEVLMILGALGMPILEQTEVSFVVLVPTNKADVTRDVDVIEEILRVKGFNSVPVPSQIKITPGVTEKPDGYALRNLVADHLAASGFNEMMGLSLSQSRFYVKNESINEELVYIHNTSNAQLDIMRPSMVVGALEAVGHNRNRQQQDLRLFEFGKTYHRDGEKLNEVSHLSMTLTGMKESESWHNAKSVATSFFTLKAEVTNVLSRLGIKGYQETQISDDTYSYGLQYHRGAQVIAIFGKLQPKLCKLLDVKGEVFFADVLWDNVVKSLKNAKTVYEEVSRFPSVRRDLALVVDKGVKFGDIALLAQKSAKRLLSTINLISVFEDEGKLGVGKKSCAVSFVFEDREKTLNEKEIDKIMSDLIGGYENKLGAVIRK